MSSVRKTVGRSFAKWRHVVCLPMMVILPVSLLADDTAAMLRSSGGVLVNKNSAPASSALFPDDLVETPQNVIARIEASGSTVDVGAETRIQFESDELALDHGTLSVNTSRSLRVRVGCVVVIPVNDAWTQYDVTGKDGKVTVSALKSDVYIESRAAIPALGKPNPHSDRVTVREGERKSREEKCGAPIKESSKYPAAGPLLNSLPVRLTGIAVISVVLCWALCRSDDPISPSDP